MTVQKHKKIYLSNVWKENLSAIVRMLCYWRQNRSNNKRNITETSLLNLLRFVFQTHTFSSTSRALFRSTLRETPKNQHIQRYHRAYTMNVMVVLLPCGLLFILGYHVSERLAIVFDDGESARVRVSVLMYI